MNKKLETEVLEIGYEEHGPPDGIPVLLLHGSPDDATSWSEVATLLAAQGFRTLAPHTRGVGPTVFRNPDTPRSGQLGALVTDAVEFLDGLRVPAAVVAGQDWGARVAQAIAALHPDRVRQLVSLGSYGLTWDDIGFPPPGALHTLWYQWVLLLDLDPRDRQFSSDLISRTVLPGVGHWPHRETPQAVATAVLDAVGRTAATVVGARS